MTFTAATVKSMSVFRVSGKNARGVNASLALALASGDEISIQAVKIKTTSTAPGRILRFNDLNPCIIIYYVRTL